jgi:glycosyltransferase involved in cell wall biosynthesis
VLHQYMPDHIGGTELYTQTLAIIQVEAGREVSIFVPAISAPTWPDPSIEDGIQVYRFPGFAENATRRFSNTFANKQIERAFEQVLKSEKPDIVHVQHLMGLPVALIEIITDCGIPYILTLHDYWYVCANAQLLTNYDNTICSGPDWWVNCARCGLERIDYGAASILSPLVAPVFALRNRLTTKALTKAHHLVAPTRFVRDLYVDHGVRADKISVIPHGIDAPVASFTRSEPVKNQLRIGYVGGLSWQKGVHVLVKAVNELPLDGIFLSIWGDPTVFPEYVDELRKISRHPGITIEGPLSRDDFWSKMSGYDVLVVPSLWYETASLVIQEAFSMGVPVVASGMGALASRVEDGVDGVLVPPDDPEALASALRELMKSPDLLQTLRSGIKPVVTIDEHAEQIARLYKTAIGK